MKKMRAAKREGLTGLLQNKPSVSTILLQNFEPQVYQLLECFFIGIVKALFIFAAALTILCLSACSSQQDKSVTTFGDQADVHGQTRELKKVTSTYVTSPLNIPSIVEKEKQVFAQHFSELNTELQYAEITSGAEQTQALASGDVQFLHAVGASSVILSAANGADIKVLSNYSSSPKAFSLISKDANIKSAAELKNKKIGGPAGTNLHQLLVSYLNKEGMVLDDVDFINMSIPDARAALEAGSIDVALLAGPVAFKALKDGGHKVVDGEGYIDALIVTAVSDKFRKQYPQHVQAFLDAQKEINEFISLQKDESYKLVAGQLDIPEQEVREMAQDYQFNYKINEDTKKGFQATADFMYAAKMIDQPFDTSVLFLKD